MLLRFKPALFLSLFLLIGSNCGGAVANEQPAELDGMSREELIDLVKDLTLQNQILVQRLAEKSKDLASAAPNLQAQIDFQTRTIQRLKGKLDRAERQLAEAEPVSVTGQGEGNDNNEKDIAPETQVELPGAPGASTSDADASLPWEYRFVYELGLIRSSGRGQVVLRDENGKRQRHEFDFTEYRRDAIWVAVTLRNDSPQPVRFTGLIELRGDSPRRERLAQKAFRTPLLQPGEVFQINEDEFAVDRPWSVDAVELTEVQGFSTPAEPDPDPGSS
ncbi:MAG: hypothetical protein AAGH99_09075 [Planctomycetota bacterium]